MHVLLPSCLPSNVAAAGGFMARPPPPAPCALLVLTFFLASLSCAAPTRPITINMGMRMPGGQLQLFAPLANQSRAALLGTPAGSTFWGK